MEATLWITVQCTDRVPALQFTRTILAGAHVVINALMLFLRDESLGLFSCKLSYITYDRVTAVVCFNGTIRMEFLSEKYRWNFLKETLINLIWNFKIIYSSSNLFPKEMKWTFYKKKERKKRFLLHKMNIQRIYLPWSPYYSKVYTNEFASPSMRSNSLEQFFSTFLCIVFFFSVTASVSY